MKPIEQKLHKVLLSLHKCSNLKAIKFFHIVKPSGLSYLPLHHVLVKENIIKITNLKRNFDYEWNEKLIPEDKIDFDFTKQIYHKTLNLFYDMKKLNNLKKIRG